MKRWLKASEVAEAIGMSVWFVYDHPELFGRVKRGSSCRYDRRKVLEYLGESAPPPPPSPDPPEREPWPAPGRAGEGNLRSRRSRRGRVPMDLPATRSRTR